MKKKKQTRNITVRKPWNYENRLCFGRWKTAPYGAGKESRLKPLNAFQRLLRWFLEKLN